MSSSGDQPKTGRRKSLPSKLCISKNRGSREHRCDKCDTNFGTPRSLKGHVCKEPEMAVTNGEDKAGVPSHSTSSESAVATTESNTSDIRRHRKKSQRGKRKNKNTSKNKQKPFACTDCDKSYSFAHGLRAHRLTHTGEKPHECTVCGKTFTQRSFLQVHSRTHTGERPYECGKCGKRFRQPSHLRYHAVSHSRRTTRGRFECTECGKRLRYQQSLRLHLRTAHEGDAGRPHKCDQCGKTFAELPKLRLHVRVHTGERPYACDLCGKAFAQKGNRDKHALRYHARDSDRKYRCDQCPKAFIWKKCLGMHQQWHRIASGSGSAATIGISDKNDGDVDEIAEDVDAVASRESSMLQSTATVDGGKDTLQYDSRKDDIDVAIDDKDQDAEADAAGLQLERSVTKLIPHLLDEEILTEIGWPSVGIDRVVVKVLRWCDQKPVEDGSDAVAIRPSTRFVRNVRTLLDLVLEEKFDEMAGLRGKSPHDIVERLLDTIKTGA